MEMNDDESITYFTSQASLFRPAWAPRKRHTDDNDAHQDHNNCGYHRNHHIQVNPTRNPGEQMVHCGHTSSDRWRDGTWNISLPLSWVPFPRRKHMTMIATMMTRTADTTGTIRFKFARTTRTGESELISRPMSGSSLAGAIVPETPEISEIWYDGWVKYYCPALLSLLVVTVKREVYVSF